MRRVGRRCWYAATSLAAVLWLTLPAHAGDDAVPAHCTGGAMATGRAGSHGGALVATRAALRGGELRILAIGSSSTSGVGASIAAATYPARLRARLQRALPDKRIVMINRGIPGETALAAAVRMEREVRSARPHLVLWQLGTNAAARGVAVERLIAAVQRTLDRLRESQLDVILLNPQFVDRFKADGHYRDTVAALGRLAAAKEISLIDRYRVMQSIDEDPDLELANYLARDAFHLNDRGYRCIASYASALILKLAK